MPPGNPRRKDTEILCVARNGGLSDQRAIGGCDGPPRYALRVGGGCDGYFLGPCHAIIAFRAHGTVFMVAGALCSVAAGATLLLTPLAGARSPRAPLRTGA